MSESKEISNKEYLDLMQGDGTGKPSSVLLPHEKSAVEQAHANYKNEFQKLVEAKVSVSGGDDWHDGAFRATDNEAKIITSRMSAIAPLLGAVVVSYPEANEERASLGSRVVISQKSFSFPVDIVGFRKAYPDGVIDQQTQEEVVAVSPDSPLGEALIGRTPGEEVEYKNGTTTFTAVIEGIDQSAVQEQFRDADNLAIPVEE